MAILSHMEDPAPPSIMLTIDVEDWFQVENLRPQFPPATWDRQQLRVERNTNNLLDLLDSITVLPVNPINPKATFFILGWIAQRLPGMVREIQARGHEVASHGFSHLMCNQMDPESLEQDLVRSKKTIEDIAGVEVRGYRAPNFSINDTAIDLVRRSGHKYDSSYNNFSRHGRYGTISLAGRGISGLAVKVHEDFMELPISNLTVANQVIPWGGGGYFRFLPATIFKAGIKRILKRSGAYMFYMHPWEIDHRQPRVAGAGYLSTWRHYLNLDKTLRRLQDFIAAFGYCRFPTCTQYLRAVEGKSGLE